MSSLLMVHSQADTATPDACGMLGKYTCKSNPTAIVIGNMVDNQLINTCVLGGVLPNTFAANASIPIDPSRETTIGFNCHQDFDDDDWPELDDKNLAGRYIYVVDKKGADGRWVARIVFKHTSDKDDESKADGTASDVSPSTSSVVATATTTTTATVSASPSATPSSAEGKKSAAGSNFSTIASALVASAFGVTVGLFFF